MVDDAWEPGLPSSLAVRAIEVSRAAAERLRDRRLVEAAAAAAQAQTTFPISLSWSAPSIAQGDAGIALTCAYLDMCFPGEGWDAVGHEYLAVAAEAAAAMPYLNSALFGGYAGLGFAALLLSRSGERYQRFLREVDAVIIPRLKVQADRLAEAPDGISVGEFDVISGLAGVGAYLLTRRANPDSAVALDAVLKPLVALCRTDGGRPCWWTPVHLMGDEGMAERYPAGNLNCGLAHGIPGPLALMALALSEGVTVQGQEEALSSCARWLTEHRADDAWGINWPVAVPPDQSTQSAEAVAHLPSRAAWCYGSPGVARALWLAGIALDNPGWRDQAVEAMVAVSRRPAAQRYIDSPTFCHGRAGLLQITLRFAHDTRLQFFEEAATALVDSLLASYEPDSLLGYRNLEPGGNPIDQPGLLDGAPGVILSLLASSMSVEPFWDRAFLLA